MTDIETGPGGAPIEPTAVPVGPGAETANTSRMPSPKQTVLLLAGLAAGIALVIFLFVSTSKSGPTAVAMPTATPTATPSPTPTPSPTLAPNTIHVVVTGDTTLDRTGTPSGTCGKSTTGDWTAAMTNPGLFVAVTKDVYRGPGTYPLTADPTAKNAFASIVGLGTASGRQTLHTTSGSIRIEQDVAHAHIEADGGFNQPPDFRTQAGHAHMVIDISC